MTVTEGSTRIRFVATYMWPGSMYMETESRELATGSYAEAKASMPDTTYHAHHALGFEIKEIPEKRFVSDDGDARWMQDGPATRIGRWYYGLMLTVAEVEDWNESSEGKYDTLLANMKGNNWPTVVRTIAGNFLPVENGDLVLSPTKHPYWQQPG